MVLPVPNHEKRWRDCNDFSHDVTLVLIPGRPNPWTPGSDGDRFYKEVLVAAKPKTVGEAIEAAKKLIPPLKNGVQGHLRWLWTWGDYIRIGGRLWLDDAYARYE
jgi:hypothetical protein